jgi:hypothetical protein
MRVRGKEVLRPRVDVGEVAPSTARDQDFASWLVVRFENCYSFAALPGNRCTKKPGGPPAQNQDVIFRVQNLTLLQV